MERCCDDQPRATHEAPTAHTVLSTHAMRRTQRRAPPRASAVSMNEHSESTPTRNKPRKKAHEHNVAIERAFGRTSSLNS